MDGGVLVVDDDPECLASVQRVLAGAGISPIRAIPDGASVLGEVREMRPDAVCLDLDLGGIDGRVILGELRGSWPDLGVLVMTGMQDLSVALECIRGGARDFLPKPFDAESLLKAVARVRSPRPPESPPHAHPAQDPGAAGMLGGSLPLRGLLARIESVSKSPLPILVTGETGTGKELAARAIHAMRFPERPFVAVNTAGLDDSMFTDALFGHVGGAFTGGDRPRAGLVEMAGDGTLFLDEIGDLAPASQVKLLRLLQESEYFPIGADEPRTSRCRIVVATHRDLARTPGFRADLYWRLRAHVVHVPPLRERRQDIPVLFRHFAAEAAREMGRGFVEPGAVFLGRLSELEFPGNIRELRGLAFDLVARGDGFKLDPASESDAEAGNEEPEGDFPTLSELESRHIHRALRRSRGNRTLAAEMLGISRQTLHTHLKRGAAEDCPVP